MILNADRTKMSKRKSQMALSAYREEGYLPEALVNFLAFLGWSPGTRRRSSRLDELARASRSSKVHHGGAVFDKDRLDHLNGMYIRAMTDEQLALRLRAWVPEAILDDDLLRLVPLIKERLVKLGDVPGLIGFVWEPDEVVASWYGPEALFPKKGGPDEARAALEAARATLAELDDADFCGGRAGAALPGGGRRRRHEGGRLLHADPGGGHRTNRSPRRSSRRWSCWDASARWPGSTTPSES